MCEPFIAGRAASATLNANAVPDGRKNGGETPIKITALQLENVKRVRAVSLTPSSSGLTILGGGNGQGKTSVLDAIAWALGGDKYRPDAPRREGSVLNPAIRVELSNGLIVERKGKNSALTVTDPTGQRYGQTLLNEFIGQFAIDLPKFMAASDKEKADALLGIIGVGDQLRDLERREAACYSDRHAIGQMAARKAALVKELPCHEGLPEEPVSAAELIRQQQAILAKNGANQRLREQAALWAEKTARQREQVAALAERLSEAKAALAECEDKLSVARQDALDLHDESTAELEAAIDRVDDMNRRIRQNLDRQKAVAEAEDLSGQYNQLTVTLENLRTARRSLLDGAPLPLPGLSVEEGRLTYKGHTWGDMSGAEQLMVSAAIARATWPQCGFLLMDKLEQFDRDTLRDFGAWLEREGLQVIATRVSTGSECTVIIEDGHALDAEAWLGDREPNVNDDGSRAKPSASDETGGKKGPKAPVRQAASATRNSNAVPDGRKTGRSPWKEGTF